VVHALGDHLVRHGRRGGDPRVHEGVHQLRTRVTCRKWCRPPRRAARR
jgi:hypothetical protein